MKRLALCPEPSGMSREEFRKRLDKKGERMARPPIGKLLQETILNRSNPWSDIYYDPNAVGLSLLAEVDLYDHAYEFDLVCVWIDDKGNLYGAADSGCSCPQPFEGVTQLGDLVEIREESDVRALVDSMRDEYYQSEIRETEIINFYMKVRKALHRQHVKV